MVYLEWLGSCNRSREENIQLLQDVINQAVAEEREACADVARDQGSLTGSEIAEYIERRGKQ